MAANKIQINRAPVLTLWAAVVAERLGFKPDEALSLGKALAGLNAQSKGRRLGIFKPADLRRAIVDGSLLKPAQWKFLEEQAFTVNNEISGNDVE